MQEEERIYNMMNFSVSNFYLDPFKFCWFYNFRV